MLQKIVLPALLIFYFLNQRARAAVDQFSYRFNGFKVKTFQGLKLVPNFGIYNPTNLPIKIPSAGLSIFVNGNQIAQYVGDTNITLNPGWTDLELNFTAKGIGAANVIYQLAQGAKFNTVSLKGTLNTTSGKIPVDYTYVYQ
jgi:hypothetical protein